MRTESRPAAHVPPSARHALASLSIIGVFACGADAIARVPADGRNQTIVATAGQEIDITLGNVGPATYASPPTISSGAVIYLGVDVVPPYNPGGPTQRFRFKAATTGQAIVTFRRVLGDSVVVSTVEDTVRVR